MEITVKIDQRKKEAKALVAYLRNLPFVTISKEITKEDKEDSGLSEGQKNWIKQLKKAAEDVKNNNTSNFIPIQTFLDEL